MAGTSTKSSGAVAYVCIEDVTHPDGVDKAGSPFTGPDMSIGWLEEGGHIAKSTSAAAKQAVKDAKATGEGK